MHYSFYSFYSFRSFYSFYSFRSFYSSRSFYSFYSFRSFYSSRSFLRLPQQNSYKKIFYTYIMLLGPHYIPDSPIYTLVATLFFTLLYILPTYGDTGTAASRGPSPEPDDRCQNQST